MTERKFITKAALAGFILLLAAWNVAGWAMRWWEVTTPLPVLGAVPLLALLLMALAFVAEVAGANMAIEVERAHRDGSARRVFANAFCALVFAAVNAYGSHNAYQEIMEKPGVMASQEAVGARRAEAASYLRTIDARIAAVPECDPAALSARALKNCGENRLSELSSLQGQRLDAQARADAIGDAPPPPAWLTWLAIAIFLAIEAVKLVCFWGIGAGQAVRAPAADVRPDGGTVVPFPARRAGFSLLAALLAALGLIGVPRGTQAVPKASVSPERPDTVERLTGHEPEVGLRPNDPVSNIRTLRERRVPWREVARITGIPKSTAWAMLHRAEGAAA